MNKGLDFIRKARLVQVNTIKELSIEQLNQIPKGFNNNIIWNMAHLIATQQIVCYRRAGVEPILDADFINAYAPGSKPEGPVKSEEIARIQELFFSTLDQFEQDLQAGLFNNYTAWTTRAGVDINTIDDVLAFLPYHEGIHMGYIQAQKRVLSP
ncbi:DinB family protein [Mucilaginibacter auburnensis]|uniref:DinB family protein n=1 Tax=Mucilaginibacter auburnensis TaxID=1457233 RepID=A0A2H9VN46_9SPHI|nr:DinB family protein [Mucilaginibacter auburnensis]PJJ79748.1 DinB family protein [Mucilaginibacter auburnensis]